MTAPIRCSDWFGLVAPARILLQLTIILAGPFVRVKYPKLEIAAQLISFEGFSYLLAPQCFRATAKYHVGTFYERSIGICRRFTFIVLQHHPLQVFDSRPTAGADRACEILKSPIAEGPFTVLVFRERFTASQKA